MPFYLDVKMGAETARRLSYAVGRSDEANSVAAAARQAAIAAEQMVRDIVLGMSEVQNVKLPARFSLKFTDDTVSIAEATYEEQVVSPQVANGKEH